MTLEHKIEGGDLGFLLAGEDLSAKEGYWVKASTAADLTVLTATAGSVNVGVLLNKPASGKAANVRAAGVAKAVAGTGGVTRGDRITSASDGRSVPVTSGRTDTSDAGAANDPLIGSHCGGIALSTAAAGERFACLVLPMGAVPQTVQ